jgi:hypothetical protein
VRLRASPFAVVPVRAISRGSWHRLENARLRGFGAAIFRSALLQSTFHRCSARPQMFVATTNQHSEWMWEQRPRTSYSSSRAGTTFIRRRTRIERRENCDGDRLGASPWLLMSKICNPIGVYFSWFSSMPSSVFLVEPTRALKQAINALLLLGERSPTGACLSPGAKDEGYITRLPGAVSTVLSLSVVISAGNFRVKF